MKTWTLLAVLALALGGCLKDCDDDKPAAKDAGPTAVADAGKPEAAADAGKAPEAKKPEAPAPAPEAEKPGKGKGKGKKPKK